MEINDIGKNHIPLKFTWEMNERCNLNCKMCYSIDEHSNQKKELSTEQALQLINILHENNVLYLFLDGGEPLLREDFFELLPKVTSKFCTWLSTNGTLIDNEAAKKMKESNLNTVFVSLHGSTSDIHDNITQVSGSFQQTISGINHLINNKVSVMSSFQLSKLNYKNLEDYIKLCKDLKIKKANILRPYPLGKNRNNFSALSLTPYEYENVIAEIDKLETKYGIDIGHSFGRNNHNCCIQAFSSDAEGSLMNCPYLRFMPRLGNALTNDMVSIWNSAASLKVRSSCNIIPSKCRNCYDSETCQGGCTAGRIQNGDTLNNKDDICGRELIKIVRNPQVKISCPRVNIEPGVKAFIYNPGNGKDYVLNRLGLLIWNILDTPKTQDELFLYIDSLNIGERKKIVSDVKKLCSILKELDLIRIIK